MVVSHDTARSPKRFLELIETEKITILNQTPSAFYQLLQAMEAPCQHQTDSLRLVVFGGEALDRESLMLGINNITTIDRNW